MTNTEAITFLNSIVPQAVNMVTLDAAKWAEFKTLALALLANPGVDPKYKAALEAANLDIDKANATIDKALA